MTVQPQSRPLWRRWRTGRDKRRKLNLRRGLLLDRALTLLRQLGYRWRLIQRKLIIDSLRLRWVLALVQVGEGKLGPLR